MDWQDILENKNQTFNWQDKSPDPKIIEKIIDDVHLHCPSKLNKVPYTMEILDWSNEQRRHKIFKNTWCDENTPEDRRNPQVLAPYLFVFYPRDTGDRLANSYAQIEIGLASMFVVMSAVNYGLDIGFCGAHNDNITLSIGVGYAGPDDPEKGGTYYNPILQKEVIGVPRSEFRRSARNDAEIKLNKTEYIKRLYRL